MKTPVLIQRGTTPYEPTHCESYTFVPYAEMLAHYRNSSVVVAHTSGGPLVHARMFQKPIVCIPRQASLGEHLDDHQLGTARDLMREEEPMRTVLLKVEELHDAIEQALVLARSGRHYAAKGGPETLIQSLKETI